MSKSIKLKKGYFWDLTSIIYNRKSLQELLFHKDGEEITIGGYYVGTFTTEKSVIQFTITTPKKLDLVDAFKTVLSGNVIIRHADGGYISNGESLSLLGELGIGYVGENRLSFALTLNEPVNEYTNNSVVTIVLRDCTLAFHK